MPIVASRIHGADLAAELRILRKGRGLQFGVPVNRIGPGLRTACAVRGDDSPHETMAKVVDWLRDRISYLPPDLRISAIAAFGLHDEVRLQFYQDRLAWLAKRLNRDARTARRRIDEAIDQIAGRAVRGGDRIASLRQLVDRTVELTVSQCGINENDEAVWRCRLLAVAEDVDDRDRHYAVVATLDEQEATTAISTTRIRRVAPIAAKARRHAMRER